MLRRRRQVSAQPCVCERAAHTLMRCRPIEKSIERIGIYQPHMRDLHVTIDLATLNADPSRLGCRFQRLLKSITFAHARETGVIDIGEKVDCGGI